MSEAPVIKRKLSGSIATMIITWVTNYKLDYTKICN